MALIMTTYEVFLPGEPRPLLLIAQTKAEAIKIAHELYPEVPLTLLQVYTQSEW